MPRDRNDSSMPRDWLARARSNLARSRPPKPDDVFWEDLASTPGRLQKRH